MDVSEHPTDHPNPRPGHEDGREDGPRALPGDAPPRRAEIEAVFDEALDLDEAERPAWVAARCGSNLALRREVEALLTADARPDRLLDAPAAALAARLVDDGARDRFIGPYRVLRELGRGGTGVVYLAERSDGQFRRRVAIKLLRDSADAEDLHRRFLAERQILASLSHPNIAQLLDGGVADGQLPYLVLEYVSGKRITEFCDQRALDVRARLQLFQHVCAAVHHAHRNLVLHRDLKPGNILVTDEGEVKLLDFGIAKLLNPVASAAEQPVTRTAYRLMTPAYASPEQVRGDSLSTASDVYALGLVLYELLTGAMAQEIRGELPRDVMEAVCEREPVRPSVRVAHTAQGGAASSDRLARRLRGDLDAIVMMALRKEPSLRYGTPDLLSADIARHLDGLPVLAHRGSRWYRARKTVRRHQGAAVAAGVVALSLFGGASAALWQSRVAARERDRATRALSDTEGALRQSEAVTGFLVSLFEASDPTEGRRDTLTAADLLRRGAARAERLAGEPLVQARMLDALGRVHASLGDLPQAEGLTRRALALNRTHLGERHLETAAAAARLAEVRQRRGDYAEADSLARLALGIRRSVPGDHAHSIAASLRQLGGLAVYLGDLPRAVAHMREAVAITASAAPGNDSLALLDLPRLGAVLWRSGELAEAIRVLRDVVDLTERVHPFPSVARAEARLRLAERLAEVAGGEAESESLARSALAEVRQALGEAHPQTAISMQQLGSLLSGRGAHAEAEGLLRTSLSVQRQALGPAHPTVAGAMNALALALARSGRLAEAERLSRDALPMWESAYGNRHSAYAGALGGLADLLERRGALDSAALLHRRAYEIRSAAVGADNALTAITALGLARTLAAQRRYSEADSIFRWALPLIRRQTSDVHPDVLRAHREVAAFYSAWGRAEDAEHHRRLATAPPLESASR